MERALFEFYHIWIQGVPKTHFQNAIGAAITSSWHHLCLEIDFWSSQITFMVKFGRTVLNVGLWFFSISHSFWDTLYIHLCREKARATDFCENSWSRLTLKPEANRIIIVRFVQVQCLISATESQDTPCMIKCSGSASRWGKLTCGKPGQIFSFKNQEPKIR